LALSPREGIATIRLAIAGTIDPALNCTLFELRLLPVAVGFARNGTEQAECIAPSWRGPGHAGATGGVGAMSASRTQKELVRVHIRWM